MADGRPPLRTGCISNLCAVFYTTIPRERMARPKGRSLLVRTSVSLDAASYADLCAISHHHGVSAAWVLRRALGGIR